MRIRAQFETKSFVADVYDVYAGRVVQISCDNYVALIMAIRRAQEDAAAFPLPSIKPREFDAFVDRRSH